MVTLPQARVNIVAAAAFLFFLSFLRRSSSFKYVSSLKKKEKKPRAIDVLGTKPSRVYVLKMFHPERIYEKCLQRGLKLRRRRKKGTSNTLYFFLLSST